MSEGRPLRVRRLRVEGFRNARLVELDTDAPVVVLHGDNAQGKTNLLEALCVLSTLRSFREPKVSRWIQDGAERARITGQVQGSIGHQVLDLQLETKKRTLTVDEKPITEVGEWFELVRAIVVAPEHTRVIRGEPVERRQFLDRAVFTARPGFLDVARDYRRVVDQKGALLRSGRATDAELDVWDERLLALGERMVSARQELLTEIEGPFRSMHARIALSDDVGLRMKGVGGPFDSGAFRMALSEARPEERRRGVALVGPHRDDLEIEIEGRSARRFASQGQARTLVLALKLAELEAARARGQAPLFLFDDLSSELDRSRLDRVSEVLSELRSQVWVTSTDPAVLQTKDAVRYEVYGGAATRSEGAR